ncbi:hypothetical protein LA76x_3984 [Lysobacter antibioticus]|uniref:Uncharacterized protein n=1 Tax=Lysobacter antibioticus TaxID=84531 RepID=A0A0S2FF14_LYSAN|nr:hypothetical protein LA76x_3984 [Lysobacter antibioticus]
MYAIRTNGHLLRTPKLKWPQLRRSRPVNRRQRRGRRDARTCSRSAFGEMPMRSVDPR